jgi:hypothetical protein
VADVRERGYEDSLYSLAEETGLRAIPVLLDEIENPESKYRRTAFYALGSIRGSKVSEILLSYYEQANNYDRGMVARALCVIPRPQAKHVYRAILEKVNDREAVDAAIALDLTEFVPLLEKHRDASRSLRRYMENAENVRRLQGKSTPEALTEAAWTIRQMDNIQRHPPITDRRDWYFSPTPEEIAAAQETILKHRDKEAAVLESLSLATYVSKIPYESANQVGVELLQALPEEDVLSVLDRLTANIDPDSDPGMFEERFMAVVKAVKSGGAALGSISK